MTYFVYMVMCSDNTLYTGITTDINRRVMEHNGVLKGGSTYTRSRRPVTLVYTEEYPKRGDALKREYVVKQYSRQEKIVLITQAKK